MSVVFHSIFEREVWAEKNEVWGSVWISDKTLSVMMLVWYSLSNKQQFLKKVEVKKSQVEGN